MTWDSLKQGAKIGAAITTDAQWKDLHRQVDGAGPFAGWKNGLSLDQYAYNFFAAHISKRMDLPKWLESLPLGEKSDTTLTVGTIDYVGY
jgi:hypothetical protein